LTPVFYYVIQWVAGNKPPTHPPSPAHTPPDRVMSAEY
jgi:hypothetical protein